MAKKTRVSIIPKTNRFGSADLGIVVIVLAATFLRVFRLDTLTEFLGDQGRTMLVLYDMVHRGVVPLSGPTTLSGQHLGPFFYYLILPGYLLSGGPVGVSLWVALLGVLATYILYKAVSIIYGRLPALLVSALYAVAPAIVTQDRIIWEPNLVPLFAILFAWLLIQQHHRISFRRVIAQGAVCGVLVQLHYPNVIFIALLAIVSFGHSLRLRRWRYVWQAMLGWLIGFLFVMLPFLVYEYTHQFSDISAIAGVFVHAGESMGKREMLMHAWDYSNRVIGKMLPGITAPVTLVLIAGWCVFLIGHFTSWNMLWSVWFAVGIMAMARYNGVVYDHYLNFLLPVPFFMAGSVLSSLRATWLRTGAVAAVCLVIGVQLMHTDIFSPGSSDIRRVSATSKQILAEIGASPFSFTLIDSRSFSDLHYRYYFRAMGGAPVPVTSASYQRLYVICDTKSCPQAATLTQKTELPVVCYDEHCAEFYPTIPLARSWRFDHEEPIHSEGMTVGTLYMFRRR